MWYLCCVNHEADIRYYHVRLSICQCRDCSIGRCLNSWVLSLTNRYSSHFPRLLQTLRLCNCSPATIHFDSSAGLMSSNTVLEYCRVQGCSCSTVVNILPLCWQEKTEGSVLSSLGYRPFECISKSAFESQIWNFLTCKGSSTNRHSTRVPEIVHIVRSFEVSSAYFTQDLDMRPQIRAIAWSKRFISE